MVDGNSDRMSSLPWLLGSLALILLTVATGIGGLPSGAFREDGTPVPADASPPGKPESGAISTDTIGSRAGDGTRFVTTIRRPSGPPLIELSQADRQGHVGRVACSTCHSVRSPDYANRTPADLDQFHQQLPLSHGNIACYGCHNPSNADTLRLADSTTVEYSDVMTLCGQCHGPQARDYQHGAHGGMNGYWDLSRGPRIRNNCIDCHDPHVPKFPSMQPTFKPRDRFLEPPKSHAGTPQDQFSVSEADGE